MTESRAIFFPRFCEGAWKKIEKAKIHPGLALYRFLDFTDKKNRGKNLPDVDISESPHLTARRHEQLETLKRNGWSTSDWMQSTDSRLACGLGIPSRLENGFFLDHTLGVPYIPGSALKGIARDQALGSIPENTEKARLYKQKMLEVFGANEKETDEPKEPASEHIRGRVIFFDAYPYPDLAPGQAFRPLELDIVNPHYGKYYSSDGRTPPADYLNPVPSNFLTVKAGIPFLFAVAARPSAGTGSTGFPPRVLVAAAREWLASALQDRGVGGKTRVGYGTFGALRDCRATGGAGGAGEEHP